jgi:hypothetical protein
MWKENTVSGDREGRQDIGNWEHFGTSAKVLVMPIDGTNMHRMTQSLYSESAMVSLGCHNKMP